MQTLETALKKIDSRSFKAKGSDCIEWIGWKNQKGYGQIRVGSAFPVVHRLVYERTYGEIPKGFCICHRCDNRKCVNPQHLFIGTNDDNIMDKCKKDRSGKKLNISKVKEIKALLKSGVVQSEIARQFGVHQTQISRIHKSQRWVHVTVGG